MAQNRAVIASRACVWLLALALAGGLAAAQGPAVDAGAVFRVFLKSGQALPSYGESALVGDRVVFTLLVGAAEQDATLQLVSLPAASVDLERTHRYADAIRSAHYAATRGAVDYAAMTQEVQRALSELAAVSDPKKRLQLAEDARKRLAAWAASTYGYRAAEVREMTALFDEVIAELRAAAGERQFSLDLRTGPAPAPEPLLPPPSIAESIELALAAAAASDSEDDRLAILRAANALAAAHPVAPAVRARVSRELDLEAKATVSYAELAAQVRAQAGAARKRGDVDAVSRAIQTLQARDQALGGRRPGLVSTLTAELDATLSSVRSYRDALARYTVVRRRLLEYEREVRPMMSGFDGLAAILTAVRDVRYTAYERLERAGFRLKGMLEAMNAVSPPADLAAVHATLISAMQMADHACARRRLSVALRNSVIAQEASSGAAGAMLLAAQARDQLVARLYPPKIK